MCRRSQIHFIPFISISSQEGSYMMMDARMDGWIGITAAAVVLVGKV